MEQNKSWQLRIIDQNEEDDDDEVVSFLLNVSATYSEFLRDGCAWTMAHAATLKQKLAIKIVFSLHHNVLGPPVLTPGAWQGSHCSNRVLVTGMTQPVKAGFDPHVSSS